eukprot:scaffold61274_cov75-Phaeocystis_antarctica.AAC.1
MAKFPGCSWAARNRIGGSTGGSMVLRLPERGDLVRLPLEVVHPRGRVLGVVLPLEIVLPRHGVSPPRRARHLLPRELLRLLLRSARRHEEQIVHLDVEEHAPELAVAVHGPFVGGAALTRYEMVHGALGAVEVATAHQPLDAHPRADV